MAGLLSSKYLSTISQSTWFRFFGRHTFFCIYNIILGFLLIGLVQSSGTDYLFYFALYVLAFNGFYLLLSRLVKQRLSKLIKNIHPLKSRLVPNLLLVIGCVGSFYHLWQFEGLPFVTAIFENNYDYLVEFRRSLTSDYPGYLAYFMGFSLKAMFPSLLFYYAFQEKRRLWIVYAIAVFYAINFLQKSLILPISLPLLILFLSQKKWKNVVLVLAIIVLFIFSMSWAMNPSVKAKWKGDSISKVEEVKANKHEVAIDSEKKKELLARIEKRKVEGYHKTSESVDRKFPLIYSIGRRVFYTPGMMVSEWFRCIPEEKPFIGVQGYSFLSPITQKPFIKYSKELYPNIHPEWYLRGYRGNVNVANFMYDYAAFGWKGLILSGFVLAMIFVFIESLFTDLMIKLSFNLYYIFFLSSSALGITLFSGGWGLMILLYFLMKDFLKRVKV